MSMRNLASFFCEGLQWSFVATALTLECGLPPCGREESRKLPACKLFLLYAAVAIAAPAAQGSVLE